MVFLQKAKERFPALPVIIMTAHSDLEKRGGGSQGGAFGDLPKPFDVDHAIELVRRAMEESLRQAPRRGAGGSAGNSRRAPAMQEVFRAIGRLSQSAATVMITGESTRAKNWSPGRCIATFAASKPLIAINTCSHSEGFGLSLAVRHERGFVTGAQTQRRGRFEQAEGNLVHRMKSAICPPICKTGCFGCCRMAFITRWAATHRSRPASGSSPPLTRIWKAGCRMACSVRICFIALNVIRLRLPPLRERKRDIPLLVRHFLQKSARELERRAQAIVGYGDEISGGFDFPGNVRQLENVCHWLTVMAPGQNVELADPAARAACRG